MQQQVEATSEELNDKTLTFWRISRAWNNHSGVDIPMHVALRALTSQIDSLNPTRPLAKQVYQLLGELIRDTGRKPHEPATITPLRQPA